MRIHSMFTRWQGGGPPANVPLLGSDVVPTAAPVYPKSGTPAADAYNGLSVPLRDNVGWPTHRIGITYKPPSGASDSQTATMYFFDQLTESWYRISPAGVTLEANSVTFFDFLGVIPFITNARSLGLDVAGGQSVLVGTSCDIVLVVAANVGATDGLHTFGIAPDLTTIGYP